MLVFKPKTMIEYFEEVLYSQPEVDNFNMYHREIIVLVGHGQNIDFIKKELWKLCQGYESKLGLEYSFNDSTKIFAIIKRYKEKIWMTRIYVRIADKNSLDGLRPDAIMVYGSFLAEQMQDVFEFIQRHSYKADLKVVFLNR